MPTSEVLFSLATLTFLEIILGIDNIVFISVLSGRLPKAQQARGRRLGLLGALGSRLVLLGTLSWVVGLTEPLFEIFDRGWTGRDLVLLFGGLFLLFKATKEIHHKIDQQEESSVKPKAVSSFSAFMTQVVLVDVIFSLDSVITAVGMSNALWVMVLANVIALGVMMLLAEKIHAYLEQHPSLKVLALGFLMMIGLALIGEGMGMHIPKGYLYFAIAFSLFNEVINIRSSSRKA